MKRLASFYEYLITFIVLFVAIHYAYQLLWAWERFWQGLVLFFLLGMGLVVPDKLMPFFENKIPLDGEFYKNKTLFFKVKWIFAYIMALWGIFILISIFWVDLESSLGIWYGWLIPAVIIYTLFLIPLSRCNSSVGKAIKVYEEAQAIETAKAEEKAKVEAQAEKERKAKEKRVRAEKRRIKKELDKKKLEEKKKEASEILNTLKEEAFNEISKSEEKRVKLENSIKDETKMIKELHKKYAFIGKIVPNRIK